MKAYKLTGENYEIAGDPVVYRAYDKAYEALKPWEDFLGMSVEEALRDGSVSIVEWTLE